MAKTSREVTARVPAVDQFGNKHEIVVLTDFEIGNTSEGPYRTAGTKTLRTADGKDLNRKEKGRYETNDGFVLTSDHPEVP